MPRVILGSASPRRKELLSIICEDDFVVRTGPEFVEPAFPQVTTITDAEAAVRDLAEQKSSAVWNSLSEADRECILLTADTVVVTEDDSVQVLGKPPEGDRYEEAVREGLRLLSGGWHSVLSGVCVRNGDAVEALTVRTRVRFMTLGDDLTEWYIATGEPRGKAGGYAIQGQAGLFVTGLEGSFSNVVGLPLGETRQLLHTAGVVVRA